MILEQWLSLSAIYFESVSWEHGHPTQLIRISPSQQKTEDAQKAVALNSCKNFGHGFMLPLYLCNEIPVRDERSENGRQSHRIRVSKVSFANRKHGPLSDSSHTVWNFSSKRMELLFHLFVHGRSRKSYLILRRQQIFWSRINRDRYPEKHRHAGQSWKKKKTWECLITLFRISCRIFLFSSCWKMAVVGNNARYLSVMSSRH